MHRGLLIDLFKGKQTLSTPRWFMLYFSRKPYRLRTKNISKIIKHPLLKSLYKNDDFQKLHFNNCDRETRRRSLNTIIRTAEDVSIDTMLDLEWQEVESKAKARKIGALYKLQVSHTQIQSVKFGPFRQYQNKL